MVLYLIGLGLGDEEDITVKGLNAVRRCSHVFLEQYTAVLGVDAERLEKFYGKKVTIADRDMVESQAEVIMEHAKDEDVAFLVVGDPFAATTHHDLVLRAAELGIKVETIHNASIMNGVAQTGLQLYQFGQTVSICFFHEQWRPDSFYDKIKTNMQNNFHTLCLLDIKVKEQSFENMAKGIKVYEPPRFMTIKQCIEQLLEVEDKRKENVYSRDSLAFGVARLGQSSQRIVSGSLGELLEVDFGGPLHSLVLCAPQLHEIEESMSDYWHVHPAERKKMREEQRRKREQEEKEKMAQRAAEREREEQERKATAAAATSTSSSSSSSTLRSLTRSKQPVRASAVAPTSDNTQDEDSESEVAMEPLF